VRDKKKVGEGTGASKKKGTLYFFANATSLFATKRHRLKPVGGVFSFLTDLNHIQSEGIRANKRGHCTFRQRNLTFDNKTPSTQAGRWRFFFSY
jgi:hypothetical protein